MQDRAFAARFNPNNPEDVQRFLQAFDAISQMLRAEVATLDQLRHAGHQAYVRGKANNTTQTQTTGQLRDQLHATATRAVVAEAEVNRLTADLRTLLFRGVDESHFPQSNVKQHTVKK